MVTKDESCGARLAAENFHLIGYIAPIKRSSTKAASIHPAGAIPADPALPGEPVTVTLERFFVERYPGRGIHRILIDFALRNPMSRDEGVHFHVTCSALDGEHAGVIGVPLFVDMKVGEEGMLLELVTINVSSSADQELLRFTESPAFRAGLRFVSTAQPALGLLSDVLSSLTKTLAGRSANIPVQKLAIRPRLRPARHRSPTC